MRRWFRAYPALLSLLAVAALSMAVGAEEKAVGGRMDPPGAGSSAPARVSRKVTLDLKEVPLREAIRLLFEGTGYSVNVFGTVPDPPVTLNLKDQEFEDALKALLSRGSMQGRHLTYNRSGTVFEIHGGVRPQVLRIFPLRFADAARTAQEVFSQLRLSGITYVVPDPRTNSLIVRGEEQALSILEGLVEHVDSGAPQPGVRCHIEAKGKLNGQAIHFTDVIRTVLGTEALVEEGTSAGKGSRFKVTLLARRGSPGAYLVTHNWEISLPLGGPGASLRLEKRLSATAPMKAGETVEVGKVNAAQWGGTGELTLFLTVQQN